MGDSATMRFLYDTSHMQEKDAIVPFRVIQKPFNEDLVKDSEHSYLWQGMTAIVSLYSDEATDYVLRFSADRSLRTAIIPCNECVRFFPPHEPTYEGFVKQLLFTDRHAVQSSNNGVPALQREQIWGTPFCQVLLQRTPIEFPSPAKPLNATYEATDTDCVERAGKA